MEAMSGITTSSGSPALSYATPARQRGYIAAMQKLAANREPGLPVRVFISVPPMVSGRPHWPKRLKWISSQMRGAEILTYENSLAGTDGDSYVAAWRELAPHLDGLVIVGTKPKPHGCVHRIGRVARREVIDLVGAGKPVLIHDLTYRLVPVVDCLPQRVGPPEKPALKMTIPRGWDPAADNPTLCAALEALRPVTPAESAKLQPSHLHRPFCPA